MFSKHFKFLAPLLTALGITCLILSGGCNQGELIEIKLPPQDSSIADQVYIGGAENIYRTDEDGTIEFITDGEHLWVRTDR